METVKENNPKTEQNKKSVRRKWRNPFASDRFKSGLRGFFTGTLLARRPIARRYPLILLGAIYVIIYIGNHYSCDYKMRRQRELYKEVEDLRYEALSISAQLTEMSRGSVVEDSVKAQHPELEVAHQPFVIIKAN